jgi:Tfp pilus assembly protein PilN
MTTMIDKTDTGVDPGQVYRPLRISANLLPAEVTDNRRTRTAKRLTFLFVSAVVVALVAWYGFALAQTELARGDVDDANLAVDRLAAQQGQFRELQQAQKDLAAIEQQLRSLMGDDLAWATVLSSLQQAQPNGVQMTGIIATVDTAHPKGGPIGTLTVAGTGTTKPLIATYVDNLAKVKGFDSPFLASVNTSTDADGSPELQFSVQITVTQDALGGRYTTPSATPSSAKAGN